LFLIEDDDGAIEHIFQSMGFLGLQETRTRDRSGSAKRRLRHVLECIGDDDTHKETIKPNAPSESHVVKVTVSESSIAEHHHFLTRID
jgi:hypothetical protein